MLVMFRKPGRPVIEDPNIPEFFVEDVAIVQRMAGGNARMTYCVEKAVRGRNLWIPVVQLVRPIALMSPGLRKEYAEILDGPEEPDRPPGRRMN